MKLFGGFGVVAGQVAAAPPPVEAFDLITTATFTSSATVNIDNCFTADYDLYMLQSDFSAANADRAVNAQLRTGGVTATGTSYIVQYVYGQESSTIAGSLNNSLSSFSYALGYSNASRTGFNILYLMNPFNAGKTTGLSFQNYQPATFRYMQYAFYTHLLDTSYDGISVAAGTPTNLTGSIQVYGWKV